jgi:hypothetical protein
MSGPVKLGVRGYLCFVTPENLEGMNTWKIVDQGNVLRLAGVVNMRALALNMHNAAAMFDFVATAKNLFGVGPMQRPLRVVRRSDDGALDWRPNNATPAMPNTMTVRRRRYDAGRHSWLKAADGMEIGRFESGDAASSTN